MIEFESIGFPEAGYARAYTERFIMFVDGEPVGFKDEWMDGKIFSDNPYHETYGFDCPDHLIPRVKEKYPDCWNCEPGDGALFIKHLNDEEIREIALTIRHLKKVV